MVGIYIVLSNGISKWMGSDDMTVDELLRSGIPDANQVCEMEINDCLAIPRLDRYINLHVLVIEFANPLLIPVGYFDYLTELRHLDIGYNPCLPKGFPALLSSRRRGLIFHSTFPSLLNIAARKVIQYTL